MTEPLPRRLGPYLLTAQLGDDALGRVYRAIRLTGERTFVRLRILEGPEISEDPVLDAIEENGEIHTFLKNPAIARGVQLDAVEGVPFLAWNEENGRTLDSLLERSRNAAQMSGSTTRPTRPPRTKRSRLCGRSGRVRSSGSTFRIPKPSRPR